MKVFKKANFIFQRYPQKDGSTLPFTLDQANEMKNNKRVDTSSIMPSLNQN